MTKAIIEGRQNIICLAKQKGIILYCNGKITKTPDKTWLTWMVTNLYQCYMDIVFYMCVSLVNIAPNKIAKFTTKLNPCRTTSNNHTMQQSTFLCFRNPCLNTQLVSQNISNHSFELYLLSPWKVKTTSYQAHRIASSSEVASCELPEHGELRVKKPHALLRHGFRK